MFFIKGSCGVGGKEIRIFRVCRLLACMGNIRHIILCLVLYSVPFAAVASEANPYSGIYKTDSDVQTYLIIKNQNDRYFGHTVYGSIEIIIANDGQFKSKDDRVGVTGTFENKVNDQYDKQTIRFFGDPVIYYRVDIPKEKYITVLYDAEKSTRNFSHPNSDSCAGAVTSAPLESVTNKSKSIKSLLTGIELGRGNLNDIDSLLILKDDKLVVENYFNGWSVDEPHTIQSVSKSLTSLLVGAAITEGKIINVNKTLPELLPNYTKHLNNGKENIPLKHFLTMSAGLNWDEWTTPYTNPNNVRIREWNSADSVAFTLDRPLQNKPGSVFTYSGGFVTVVGEVLREATQQPSVSDYAKNGPLSALCFKNAYWFDQADTRTNVAGGAGMRPRDMLKLGQLVLNDGKWNGEQIIDKAWIHESTQPIVETKIRDYKYGYYWWVKDFTINGKQSSVIFAQGFGGQDIVIIKDLNLVVVKTASNYDNLTPIETMLTLYIIPAFKNQKI